MTSSTLTRPGPIKPAHTPLGRTESPYEAWIVPEPADPHFVSLVRENVSQADREARALLAEISPPPIVPQQAPIRNRISPSSPEKPIKPVKHRTGSCKRCFGPYDEIRPGCIVCINRHYMRERHRVANALKSGSKYSNIRRIPKPRGMARDPEGTCSKCGCLRDDFTKGCKTCNARRYSRVLVIKARRIRLLGHPLVTPAGQPLKRLVSAEKRVKAL